jgi:hypothetical protein
VIRRITENQIAAHGLYWETSADIMVPNVRPARLKVISKTTTPHGLADVKRGSPPGHGVDNEASRGTKIMQGMSDNGRGY